jgi:hypothetical protein
MRREKGPTSASTGRTQAVHYRDARGRQPVSDFIDSLSMKGAKKIEDGIQEHLIALLHGFEKNTGAVPASAKALAVWRMADFKKRMEASPRRPPRPAGSDAP